eukprot:4970793-Prymnesium_polylepis.1
MILRGAGGSREVRRKVRRTLRSGVVINAEGGSSNCVKRAAVRAAVCGGHGGGRQAVWARGRASAPNGSVRGGMAEGGSSKRQRSRGAVGLSGVAHGAEGLIDGSAHHRLRRDYNEHVVICRHLPNMGQRGAGSGTTGRRGAGQRESRPAREQRRRRRTAGRGAGFGSRRSQRRRTAGWGA